VLWLDANDASSLTIAAHAFSMEETGHWRAGVSGTNLWFTQNTTTLQPWITNSLNGKPVLTSTKTGTVMARVALPWQHRQILYTNNNSQMTYFVVARQSENSIAWQGR